MKKSKKTKKFNLLVSILVMTGLLVARKWIIENYLLLSFAIAALTFIFLTFRKPKEKKVKEEKPLTAVKSISNYMSTNYPSSCWRFVNQNFGTEITNGKVLVEAKKEENSEQLFLHLEGIHVVAVSKYTEPKSMYEQALDTVNNITETITKWLNVMYPDCPWSYAKDNFGELILTTNQVPVIVHAKKGKVLINVKLNEEKEMVLMSEITDAAQVAEAVVDVHTQESEESSPVLDTSSDADTFFQKMATKIDELICEALDNKDNEIVIPKAWLPTDADELDAITEALVVDKGFASSVVTEAGIKCIIPN